MKQIKCDGMILVHDKTLIPACEGEIVKSFRGEVMILTGGRSPHKQGSTGFVWVEGDREFSASQFQFYPSVFDLVWVPESETKGVK